MRSACRTILAAAVLSTIAAPAFADITAFIGATTTPANRLARGLAAGAGLVIIGFEFEYADTTDDPLVSAPSLKTGMANVLFQTPTEIFGFQPYFTTGGGVKIRLAGPLRARIDYRVFKLGSGALHSPAHRVYVGLNVKL